METAERVDLASRGAVELLTPDELTQLFAREAHPKAYIGFEPSGPLTVGHLVTARKMRDLVEAGCDLTVFLADWHAWINDKLGGSLERIEASGREMQAAFAALGVEGERVHYRWAHELVEKPGYWDRVVRVAKATTLARTKRAMTILGRSEEEASLDTAKLFYPAMQAADVFELPVDLAYAGLDQRRAHVLAREVAHHYGWPVPVGLHTALISSLKGGGRMDPVTGAVDGKMSKSDPGTALYLTASSSEVEARIRAAFCPAKEVEGNPVVELARYAILPWEGSLEVTNAKDPAKSVAFTDPTSFVTAYSNGEVHPTDLKAAVTRALDRILAPVRNRSPS